MPEEHVMQIDPQYPYSKQSDEGSDAGSRNEDTQQQQQGDQQPYEEQSVQTDQEGQEGRQATGDPREAIVALRRENQRLKQQMQYMSAVVQQSQQQPQQPGQQQDIFAEYDDDDVITVADMKKVLQQQGQPRQQGQPQQRGPDVRELQMMVQFPDYEQEIQKIPKLLENAKFLVSAISNSENPFMTAYFLAKHFADGQPQQQPKGQGGNNQVAQQIMDNLSKPRSVSQAGSGGTIARANYYAQLDDDALEAEIAKAKRG